MIALETNFPAAPQRQRGDQYVLNGTKMWITNAGDADTMVVYAKTDPDAGPKGMTAFIIEKGFKGLSFATKLGMRCLNTYPVFFDNCVSRPRTCWASKAAA